MSTGKNNPSQDGYALIENMIILPIVFLVVYALLFAGFILHAQCTIESAARRGINYAGKLICDPQYNRVTASAIDPGKGELNELSNSDFDFSFDKDMSYKPYRYLFGNKEYADTNGQVKSYVRKILDHSSTWMFKIEDSGIVCDVKNLVLFQKAKVKITAKYPLPKVFTWLGIEDSYDLKAEAVATVSDQDEFIRNVDFVEDICIDLAEKTQIGKSIAGVFEKMKGFVNKLFK